jgi:hypothetical protein
MKRLLVAMVAAGLLFGAAAFSRNDPGQPPPEVQVKVEDCNPWNHLRFNNDRDCFQFAFVSDRTGGARPNVFERAVQQLNLLQPEFVLSVGDLIQGGTEDQEKLTAQWKEFDGHIAKLEMPFFYVPGNHDISNAVMDQSWREKFGRRYYHFVYRNVLFLLLNSEDPPRVRPGRISPEQVAYVQRVLEENRSVRWTIVALHKPLWTAREIDQTGWLEVEKALAGRPYTVFAGHVHRYERWVRNGQRYYQLATTGGSSKLRGVDFGEFDHVVWVTMKKDGPVLANLRMEGIFPEDMKLPESPDDPVKAAP